MFDVYEEEENKNDNKSRLGRTKQVIRRKRMKSDW
jgi:hypothetical protein